MDYERIGQYIALKRKEKEMTQKVLAEHLGITDRAVSRWERGLGCPDISLLETLAQILNVSVLEILQGQDIKDEKKENEAIVHLLNKNSKKINLWKTIALLIINFILLMAFLGFIFLFLIPQQIKKEPNKNFYTIDYEDMTPDLKLYDGVIVKKIDITDIQYGDIIAFVSNASYSNGLTLIHRVEQKKSDEKTGEIYLETKSDKYGKDGGFVTKDNLIGILEKRIPLVGHFLPITVNNKLLFIMNIIIIISILFLDFIQLKNVNKKL